MSLRDLGFYVRGKINSGVSGVLNARGAAALLPMPLPTALEARLTDGPERLVPLLEGRTNVEREAALGKFLEACGVPFDRHRFTTFEGRGENLFVDLGSGDRVLVLIAHHDAVPGSPGANDNAAAVAILLHLLARLTVPPGLRVRLLFTAAEEIGYLGARALVRDLGVRGIVGVLSLELCGIGDSLAIWDAAEPTPFLGTLRAALEGLGRRSDEGYHVVGRIPVFGSDHRAFAAAGVPAYGLSIVPSAQADALRRFVLNPVRAAFMHLVRRPPPFDTYHTRRDAGATLEVAALGAVTEALEAIVTEVG